MPSFLKGADQGDTVGMSSLGNKVLIREGVMDGEVEIGAGGGGGGGRGGGGRGGGLGGVGTK